MYFTKYVHFNGLKFSGTLVVFFHLRILGFKNENNFFLKEIRDLSVIFSELKYR